MRLAIAVRHQRRRRHSSRCVVKSCASRIGRGDSSRNARIAAIGYWSATGGQCARSQVEALLGARHDRSDRPERVVQIQRDRADAHDRGAQ